MQRSLKSYTNSKFVAKSPIDAVGNFLQLALPDTEIPNRAGVVMTFSNRSQVLHLCHGYSHDYLIRMLLSIYKGFPESYQVLICRPCLSEEDIHLFLKRILNFPSLYVVLQVNSLPIRLQEVSMTFFDSVTIRVLVHNYGPYLHIYIM